MRASRFLACAGAIFFLSPLLLSSSSPDSRETTEGHGFEKRENRIDAVQRTLQWFDKYLKTKNSGKPRVPRRLTASSGELNVE